MEAFDANVYLQLGDAQVEISPHQEGGLEIKVLGTAANKNQNLALGICAVVFATAKVLLENFTDFSFRFFSLQGLIFSILFVVCVQGLAHLLNDGISSSSSYYAHVTKSVAEVLSKGRAETT